MVLLTVIYLSKTICPWLSQVVIIETGIIQGEVSIHTPGVEASSTGVEVRAGTLIYIYTARVGVTSEANLHKINPSTFLMFTS